MKQRDVEAERVEKAQAAIVDLDAKMITLKAEIEEAKGKTEGAQKHLGELKPPRAENRTELPRAAATGSPTTRTQMRQHGTV